MECRSCGNRTEHVFVDLIASPAANSFVPQERSTAPEPYYPLTVYVCDRCFLVQIEESKAARETFTADYVYFSSYTEAFVSHASRYVDTLTGLLGLDGSSFAVEAASNDGYLLQFFKQKGIPCLGVEPSASTARAAVEKGIDTLVEFFTEEMARKIAAERGPADVFIGNNVIAHVPDLNDFIAGIRALLKPEGVAAIEFPHLLNLIRELQFDTIYHEHYSYLSLIAISQAFARHGMYIFRVDEQPVHGGSLRIYCAIEGAGRAVEDSVGRVLAAERAAHMDRLEGYSGLQDKVDRISVDFLRFLIDQKRDGRKVIGYGAAAKGNTLLNYCGVKPYLMEMCIDITPAKQNKLLPGSRIPVYGEEKIREVRPDYIVILPWNWQREIKQRLGFVAEWGCRFVTAVPRLTISDAG